MAKVSKFSEESAVQLLTRNGVSVGNRVITHDRAFGLTLWGAIDYLVNHKGYSIVANTKRR